MTEKTVVVSGASGLIGRALTASLRKDGFDVLTLVRREPETQWEIQWDPEIGQLPVERIAGTKAIVNLNGASIGRLPWTRNYRKVLLESRVRPTRTIATGMLTLGSEAPAFVSASAVGFYGDRPGEILNESSPAGSTFLAGVCRQWEETALEAAPATRVALIRTAPVLDPDGVLKPMVLLTKVGLGGPIGPGSQVWPWITLRDEVDAIRHVIDNEIQGPVNLSSPRRTTEAEIGKSLAKAMNRPFWFKAPSFAVRAVVGKDAADSLLLSDTQVVPGVLLSTGFTFQDANLEDAIAGVLS